MGFAKPLIVTDQNLITLCHVATVTDVLDSAGAAWGVFDDVVEDPTDACVDAGLSAFAQSDYDCVIGFGGGSPMDTAKAISFMSVKACHLRDCKAPYQIDYCGPPVILIPTTGATGSELTRLNDDLKVPCPSELGHAKDDAMFSVMVEQALASGSPENNPRIPSTDEIIQLYQHIWSKGRAYLRAL